MEKDFLLAESIQERDIDLILLEELNTNKEFCQFIIDSVKLPKITSNNIAWKSVMGFGIGETDLLFSYKSKNEIIFILIENKLDADFQNNQFKRYLTRAKKYIDEEKCNRSYVLLIAPKEYCNNQKEFNRYITYETIESFFKNKKTDRNEFKAHLLKIGIEKLRRGYQAVNDIRVHNFWNEYNKVLKEKTKQLYINPNALKVVPSNADWIYFRNDLISKLKIKIIHKLKFGYIDIQIKNSNILEKLITTEKYKLTKTGKSDSLRVNVHPLIRNNNFEEQKNKVDESVNELIKLYNFFVENIK
tara:strand:- start:276 stop:1181 length:906 start_codon:yes stop_codon:yes gene_type:complete